ncbi:beta strand repeat-containing protein, partial [Lacticaseibacillus nasuensis]|uniref:beta strand repeat-containing protein n=1 Tax=Lacticaseibacillus nasuensis TaxID=944671 RepID=UPI00138F09D6
NAKGEKGTATPTLTVTDASGATTDLATATGTVGTYTLSFAYTDGGKTVTKTATLNVVAQSSLTVTYHDQTTGEVIGTKTLEGGKGTAYDGFTATIDQMTAANGVDGSKYTEATTDYVTVDGEPTAATEVPAGTFDGGKVDVYVKHVVTSAAMDPITWTITDESTDGKQLGQHEETATWYEYTDQVTGEKTYSLAGGGDEEAFTDAKVSDYSSKYYGNPTIGGQSVKVGDTITAPNLQTDDSGFTATKPTDAETTVVYSFINNTKLTATDQVVPVGTTLTANSFKPTTTLPDGNGQTTDGTYSIKSITKTADADEASTAKATLSGDTISTTGATAGTYTVVIDYTGTNGATAEGSAKLTVTDDTGFATSPVTAVKGTTVAVDQFIVGDTTNAAKTKGDSTKVSIVSATNAAGQTLAVTDGKTISADQAGDYTVTLSYTDGGKTVENTATLTVTDGTLLTVQNKEAKVGDTLTEGDFTKSVVGADGKTPLEGGSYAITALKNNDVDDKTSATLTNGTITTTGDTSGSYTATITYTNGALILTDDVQLTITDGTKLTPTDKTITVGDSVAVSDFVATATNAHGDAGKGTPSITSIKDAAGNPVADLATAAKAVGTYTLSLDYTDGGKTVHETATLTVTANLTVNYHDGTTDTVDNDGKGGHKVNNTDVPSDGTPTDVGNGTTAKTTPEGGVDLTHGNGDGTSTETTVDPNGKITSQITTTPIKNGDGTTTPVTSDGKGGHTVNGKDV